MALNQDCLNTIELNQFSSIWLPALTFPDPERSEPRGNGPDPTRSTPLPKGDGPDPERSIPERSNVKALDTGLESN